MKPPNLFLTALAVGGVAFTLLAQTPQTNSSTDPDAKASGSLVLEIQAQQKTISENQAKIDEQLAAIGEQVRLARIFVSRGGKAK